MYGIGPAEATLPTGIGNLRPICWKRNTIWKMRSWWGASSIRCLRNADRVKVACLAQLINVIAPLMTNSEHVLRQTIYYPYAWALKYARGRVMDLIVESDTYPIQAKGLRADYARDDKVPYVDVAVTVDSDKHRASVFMLNRNLDSPQELTLDWRDQRPSACWPAKP